MKNISILIVEDDIDTSNMLKDLLSQNGYLPNAAYSGTEAIMCIERNSYNLILLDLMLPGLSGEEVLYKIKETTNIPVMAVSAKDDMNSKITLLKGGADDYMTKPFNIYEILARIEALLRRYTEVNNESSKTIIYKDIKLIRTRFEVSVGNTVINLTKHEYLILELLMSNPKKVFTKNNIFEMIWNTEYLGEDNSINVHISNIRAKIAKVKPGIEYIQTVWGIGFKMSL